MASRRDFLKLVAVAGASGGAVLAGLRFEGRAARVSETRILMGTIVNLTVVGGSASEARQALEACLERMAELEAVFSRFIPHSALSILNRDGFVTDPPAELVEVLRAAHAISSATAGAYDVTVKPLYDLYRSHSLDGNLPPDEAVAAACQLVGFSHLQVSEPEIAFDLPGMSVTLDSIAKGYIIDQGVSTLKERGYVNVMVEAGGDLMASGAKGRDGQWQVGVRSPRPGGSSLYGKFGVSDQAVASSGDYFQYFSSDLKNHHIIDPLSGYSSPYLCGASVIAPTCMEADGYATALMVMDPDEGIALVEGLAGFEALLISKNLEAMRTSGFDY